MSVGHTPLVRGVPAHSQQSTPTRTPARAPQRALHAMQGAPDMAQQKTAQASRIGWFLDAIGVHYLVSPIILLLYKIKQKGLMVAEVGPDK